MRHGFSCVISSPGPSDTALDQSLRQKAQDHQASQLLVHNHSPWVTPGRELRRKLAVRRRTRRLWSKRRNWKLETGTGQGCTATVGGTCTPEQGTRVLDEMYIITVVTEPSSSALSEYHKPSSLFNTRVSPLMYRCAVTKSSLLLPLAGFWVNGSNSKGPTPISR